ncbi:FAD-binding oxidoreductase [Salinisphaera sp. USBA-960]|nr:FAD-binding oxidoreductase [Salifodinibacter halophilus]NNC26299.1 FAD-binding oxidoreductase [Salifodinibacter halophilus]
MRVNQGFFDALVAIVGAERVLTGAQAAPYLCEWRGAFTPRAAAVVLPADTDAVAAIVTVCGRYDANIVAQSGNTGLVGGSAASDADSDVIISLAGMDRIRAVDTDDNTITVEAGAILADVKAVAAAAHRYFPLSLASATQCRIGGNLATNAGGLNVLRYGNTRDLTLGLEVVLADGRVWSSLSPLVKDNSGFDLRDLFIGSEGTLGIITAATLRLYYPERQHATALCAAASPADALAITRTLIDRSGGQVVACELMANQAVQLVRQFVVDEVSGIAMDHDWYILLELASSATGNDLQAILDDVMKTAGTDRAVPDYALADTHEEREALWRLRESIPAAQRAAGASIKHDIALPVAQMPAFLARALPAVEARLPGVRACTFGHLGDGNIHFNLTRPLDGDNTSFLAESESVHRLVHELVLEMGGSSAAEHGVGRLKVADMARYKSPVEQAMTRAVKQALDPETRLNPGVLVDQ